MKIPAFIAPKPVLASVAVVAASLMFMAFGRHADDVITRDGKTTIVNTTTLASDVEGYAGPTPLKIYIKGGKVEKIEALPNTETPKYFALVARQLLDKWNGLTSKKAATQEVDVVTGATFSSEAVIENVRRGLNHYNKSGKK